MLVCSSQYPWVMRSLTPLFAGLILLAIFAAGPAHAQARHERVTITAVKAKGKVVGARIKTTMRPQDGYNRVQLVIGKPQVGKYDGQTYRAAAAGQTKGYVLHQGEPKVVSGHAEQVEFVVMYDAKKGLTPGAKVDLTSVWAKGEKPSLQPGHPTSLHVWGMTRNGEDRSITLPEK